MPKEIFNWKSIFVNDENSSVPSDEAKIQTSFIPNDNKFPETNIVTNSVSNGNNNNPFLNEILEVYNKGFEGDVVKVDKSRFEDLHVSVDKQKYFGKDGLYFCGFWIAPTGQIREIGLDAQKIVKNLCEAFHAKSCYVAEDAY